MVGKNIGIITFHRADNLGAVLQTYALQRTIEKSIGASVEVIDYECQAFNNTKHTKKHKTVKDCIKFLPMHVYYCIKHRGFEKFRDKKLRLSQKRYNKDNLVNLAKAYDIFITGSDQVWNLRCSANDMTYFLDFVSSDKKKISYAASVGEYRYTDEEAKMVGETLKRFDGISVREESAVRQLESIGVNGAVVVPDPVILLSDKEWKGIMKKRLCRQKYILVYLIADDVNVTKNATEYARLHNCKIINNKKSIEFIMHNSPEEFLSWIFYAECVFTNSFHGTAFSLIFNKPLCADVELKGTGINGRVKELLLRAGAKQCILDKHNLQVCAPEAKEALEKMKETAMTYLKNNCQ